MPVVCFDLGNVVVEICRNWREAAAEAGVPYQSIVDAPEPARLRQPLVHAHERGEITCRQYYEGLAGLSGGAYTAEETERVHLAWIRREHPGLLEIVMRLENSGVRVGCLSNTNATHWEFMHSADDDGAPRFPAIARMSHRLGSHEARSRKPEAEIFAQFEQLSGAAGSAIVFFDDLPTNIDAASEIGWDSIWIDPTLPPADQITAALRARSLPTP